MKKIMYIASYNKSITSVVDTSDDYMARARLTFTDGNILSIIKDKNTYDTGCGLYEIAIIDDNNTFITSEVLAIAKGDDVIGDLTETDVHDIIIEVSDLCPT